MSPVATTAEYVPVRDPARNVDLLAGIERGDRAAWEEIVIRYEPMVRARARTFRMQEADVHDAVQNTWLRLAQHAATVRFPERLGGWLRTTVERECLGILRRPQLIGDDAPDECPDQAAGPEQRVIDGETVLIVRAAVDELPTHQRRLMHLLLAEQCSYAQISTRSGTPVGSIGPTRMRALRLLRRALREHGLAPAS